MMDAEQFRTVFNAVRQRDGLLFLIPQSGHCAVVVGLNGDKVVCHGGKEWGLASLMPIGDTLVEFDLRESVAAAFR